MNNICKLLVVLGILTLISATPLFATPQVQAQNSPEVDRLSVFFRDVLMINISACILSDRVTHSDNSPELGTRGVMQGQVTLTSENSGSVDASYEFRGPFLVWCILYYDRNNVDPLPYLKTPLSDPVDRARQFLENYEKFTNDSIIGDMAKLLEDVKEPEPLTKTAGNLKLEIKTPNGPYFEWSYTFEGEDYRILTVSFATPPHILSFGYQNWKYNLNSSAFPVYEPLNSGSSAAYGKVSAGNTTSASSLPLLSFILLTSIAVGGWVVVVFLRQSNKEATAKLSFRLKLKGHFISRPKLNGSLKKKLAVASTVVLLLMPLTIGLNMDFVQGNFLFPPLERIYITNEGAVSPSSAPINRTNDTSYTLTGPITNHVLVVQRDNIVLDGVGFLVQKNMPAMGRQDAIELVNRTNVTVKNIVIDGFIYGAFVSNSSNCTITQIRFSNNSFGVVLANQSVGNSIVGNDFTSGGGIAIYYSPNNILKNNTMAGTGPNLWIDCEAVMSSSDFVNDIDSSNTVNGKPVCYWIGQHDRAVPAGAGYVGLIDCNGITVQNLNLTNNGQGLLMVYTDNSTVSGNTFADNNKAIAVYSSKNNSFSSNTLIHNANGIALHSRPNTFKNNQLINNTVDANFEDRFFDEFDRSNIVDGTPICYWLWQNDKTVPVDSGYVVLLSCKNITVQNLFITDRRQAMLLSEVTDSTIARNTIINNGEGILMAGSSNNQIVKNLLANNTYGIQMINSVSNNVSTNRLSFNAEFGIRMDDCSNNSLAGNYISHGKQGLVINRGNSNTVTGNSIFYTREKGTHIGESTNNLVTGNTIAWSNSFALTITGDVGNNSLYHNNFINNAGTEPNQAAPGANTPNIWDNGQEGNFLSDYQNKYPTAKQVHDSDVWNTPVVMKGSNIDRFPLVKPVTMTYEVTVLQPTNSAYNTSSTPLVFFASGPVPWMGYSVDDGANITVTSEVSLIDLPMGIQNVTVYAGIQNGLCGSDTVQFQVTNNTTSPITPSASPTLTATATPPSSTPTTSTPQNPTPSPSTTPTTKNLLSDLQWPIIAAVIIAVTVILAAVGTKRKH